MFVCLGLTSLLNICGHITTVPSSSSTFTNVLPHRNAMQQTQDMTPHPSQNSDTITLSTRPQLLHIGLFNAYIINYIRKAKLNV